jgi:hypothetical protein
LVEKNYPTSVSLSPETRKRLKAYGKPRKWSVSRIVEWVVVQWLDHQEQRENKDK